MFHVTVCVFSYSLFRFVYGHSVYVAYQLLVVTLVALFWGSMCVYVCVCVCDVNAHLPGSGADVCACVCVLQLNVL